MMKYKTLRFLFSQGQMIFIKRGFDITQRSVRRSNESFWTSVTKKTEVMSTNKIKFESLSLRIKSFMKIINNVCPTMLPYGIPSLTGCK